MESLMQSPFNIERLDLVDGAMTQTLATEGRKAHWMIGYPTILLASICLVQMPVAQAELSNQDLAKMTQNPVSEMISLPFQNNTYLNAGQRKETRNVLDIQPIIPLGGNGE